MTGNPRLMVLGAHPDDAEFHAGGLIARYSARGWPIKLVSVTNGAAGHQFRTADELAALRREEAAAAGRVVGAPYECWDFADGALQPTLEVRHRIIAEIRRFQPDLVLTHRPNDYHPDHRAVGQAVADASFLVTVPLVVPEVPALRRDPVVAYMVDPFTKPQPLKADVALDVTAEIDTVLDMLACHASQMFEWLPYVENAIEPPPAGAAQRRAWLRRWFLERTAFRTPRFRSALHIDADSAPETLLIEAYEISEYASSLDAAAREKLFPAD